ncbi:MAG: iron-sulfur cluster carrier protein ApbC [Planctomycetes bacterium]|nr:iron-sulfur cluster carrier protein ApbC [Planctomycetota bacterium]
MTAPAVTEADVLGALRGVQDPDLHRDIVQLGFVKHLRIADGLVSFSVELTTPACPVKEQLKAQATQVVQALPGVRRVEVTMTAQVRPSLGEKKKELLPGVKNVIAVASGKGGVGKSTVSANLALALAKMGSTVGLLDADVYGPSIPLILGTSEKPRVVNDNTIVPVVQHGLKVISMAFFMKEGEAVIWRGPMLHGVVQQFLGNVDWGDLDYLVIDLPPGTGDIQLSLCQTIPLTGAVVVSTPQDVALTVAMKAIAMFKKLNTPILGILENMSYFLCTHCGERSEVFGHGGARRAAERLGIPFLGEIPLDVLVRSGSDEGKPIVVTHPDSPQTRGFVDVACATAAQISIRNVGAQEKEKLGGFFHKLAEAIQ